MLDGLPNAQRASAKIGTTGRGIGPCYDDKVARLGVRVGDLFDRDAPAPQAARRRSRSKTRSCSSTASARSTSTQVPDEYLA